jgi:aminoacylase
MTTKKKQKIADEHVAVTKFREYLRVNTMHPNPDYYACAEFLKVYAKDLGLEYNTVEMVKGKPIVIMTWKGKNPELKSIILNSHTDVVPVDRSKWTVDPLSAHKRANGDIVARGSQDMKCVGIWYLEAIRQLRKSGVSLKRTLHLTFVPDEEIGGMDGMGFFVQSEHFKKLNAGFALDEGLANENDAFKVYYGERSPWWIRLKATGAAGHASKFIEPSAMERMLKVLARFSAFRESERQRLENYRTETRQNLTLGDVTTTNITLMTGGVQMNVVPNEVTAGIDMRLSPYLDFELFEKTIRGWCEPEGVELTFEEKTDRSPFTLLTSENREWNVFQEVARKRNVMLETEIFPAATDSRFLRQANIPAFGFSAIKKTPVLLHDHDEYLNENTLIEGIGFYVDILTGIANLD